ncbi:MAG: undecaprenyl-phosphate glucose phosphotransferase [Cyanobacteriota bacterium]|nr:undecaprenyl-phosphate glucose phosphotransferase [Cyanobacteriota bacterium]
MSPIDQRSRLWTVLALLSDGCGLWLSFVVAFGLRTLAPHALLPLDIYMGLATVAVISYWGITAWLGGYRESKLLSRFDEVVTVWAGLALAFALILAGAFFIRSISLSRLVVGYAAVLAWMWLTLTRLGLRGWMGWLRRRGWGIRESLWVGENPLLSEVKERLERLPQLGFRLVGVVGNSPKTTVEGIPYVCDLEHLTHYLQSHPQIGEVWFAQPELATQERLLSLHYLGRTDLNVRLLPDILAFVTVNLSLQLVDGIPLLTLKAPPLRFWHNRLLKRSTDVVGSLLGLILLSPLLVGIGLAVRLSSPGPILYRQERISLDGHCFWIYKFRTMRVDAESNQQPGWTIPDDPRRTPLGSLLRRFNLDELPQLWNVLRGEMSLVGPRPERPYFVEQFSREIPKYLDRHLVKTGVTGWAQIHGLRGDTSIARRTQYDLYYVQNWSFLLDLRIIVLTIWQALVGKIEGY